MKTLIYDAETCRPVYTPNGKNVPGITYARDWDDYRGMGVSVVCAYSYLHDRFFVFTQSELQAFAALVAEHDVIVGFNSKRFDDALLNAHGVPVQTTYDLYEEVCEAARRIGIDPRKKRGYNLDSLAQVNLGAGKAGSATLAPLLYQAGKLGELITYCLHDVELTRRLYGSRHRLICPKTRAHLPMATLVKKAVDYGA